MKENVIIYDMTIKEKFEECLWSFDKSMIKNQSEKCEAIADNYYIGFAEWIFTNGRETIRKANEDGLKSTKELLEIYKKEKGL
jgi:hypothetical protein